MKHLLYILSFVFCLPIMAESQTTRINKNLDIYTDVMRQLDINYVDTLNYDQLISTSINAMLNQVDPYTIYMPKSEDDQLRMMTTGKYGGIGAVIMQRDSNVYISDPYEHMPAAEAGLMAGDRIVSVDGMSCQGKNTQEVRDQSRGKPGTSITIVVERGGNLITTDIKRRDVHLPAVGYTTVLSDSIGYILFSDFTANSAQEFLLEVDKMVQSHHINQLIIDLRNNGGGLINEAIDLLSFFLPKGTEVVSTKGKLAKTCHTYATESSPIFPDMKLAVMVNKNSASAAEIVAGALQDLDRATIIGQRTFGKGLVQNVRPIVYGGHLKVTTSKYYLPSGRCIQAIDYAERQKGNKLQRDTAGGILPDIVLTDTMKLDITYNLYRDQMFFDYATRYRHTHSEIASATDFQLTDADFEDFFLFLKEKNFYYETETGRYLGELIDMAKQEDIDSTLLADLEAFRPRLIEDYRTAIHRNRKAVEEYLGGEIVKRYYYHRGYYAYILRYDKELQQAIEAFK